MRRHSADDSPTALAGAGISSSRSCSFSIQEISIVWAEDFRQIKTVSFKGHKM